MREGLLTPPASPDVEEDLRQTLDGLLEQYLYLLDKQQKLQEELGKHMSAGFFSLVRANQSCPPGRHFGEDYYDERMKAIRTLDVTTHKPVRLSGETQKAANNTENNETKEGNEKTGDNETKTPLFRIIRTPAPETKQTTETETPNAEDANDDDIDADSKGDAKEAESKSLHKRQADPLRWFGILVPPPLRSTQGSFISAVEGPVPALASVVAEMRVVEGKVDELRDLIAEEESKGVTS